MKSVLVAGIVSAAIASPVGFSALTLDSSEPTMKEIREYMKTDEAMDEKTDELLRLYGVRVCGLRHWEDFSVAIETRDEKRFACAKKFGYKFNWRK